MKVTYVGPYYGNNAINRFVGSLVADDTVMMIFVMGATNAVIAIYTDGTEKKWLFEIIEDHALREPPRGILYRCCLALRLWLKAIPSNRH